MHTTLKNTEQLNEGIPHLTPSDWNPSIVKARIGGH
jgi:hypothetical protein